MSSGEILVTFGATPGVSEKIPGDIGAIPGDAGFNPRACGDAPDQNDHSVPFQDSVSIVTFDILNIV